MDEVLTFDQVKLNWIKLISFWKIVVVYQLNHLIQLNPTQSNLINHLTMRFYILILLFIPLVAFSQDSLSTHYKIYSVARQKEVSLDDIANDLANADVLFFGEEHNDSTGHYLEYALFKKLSQKYQAKIALSMEMFETDCQNVLDEYLDGFIQEKSLITDARAWHNYKDYRPLIEWAKTYKIPVVAANAPHRYVNMVNRL